MSNLRCPQPKSVTQQQEVSVYKTPIRTSHPKNMSGTWPGMNTGNIWCVCYSVVIWMIDATRVGIEHTEGESPNAYASATYTAKPAAPPPIETKPAPVVEESSSDSD